MRTIYQKLRGKAALRWRRFLLARSGPTGTGRLAAWLVSRAFPPHHGRAFLANLVAGGFMDPAASIRHPRLRLGRNTYIGARVVVSEANSGGLLTIGDRVHLYGDSFVETGHGGSIVIGADTHIQPGCHLHSHLAEIHIGEKVEIAANCAFYNYDHGTAAGIPIMDQPLRTRGDIMVGDGAWIGHGVTVLQGVTIGEGAVIAAGAVVISDIPANAIAAGVPARVVKHRGEAPSRRPLTPTPLT
jgi:acetyltransferase-like isoleucine patch superfamily enzyme